MLVEPPAVGVLVDEPNVEAEVREHGKAREDVIEGRKGENGRRLRKGPSAKAERTSCVRAHRAWRWTFRDILRCPPQLKLSEPLVPQYRRFCRPSRERLELEARNAGSLEDRLQKVGESDHMRQLERDPIEVDLLPGSVDVEEAKRKLWAAVLPLARRRLQSRETKDVQAQ